jgi:hypothetical protein
MIAIDATPYFLLEANEGPFQLIYLDLVCFYMLTFLQRPKKPNIRINVISSGLMEGN